MANFNVLIPHAASDNALYLEEGKYWIWENTVLRGPWSWQDCAVCKKLQRGPWRESESPVNQAVIWTDGQSTPVMLDYCQYPTCAASKFERSNWMVVRKRVRWFSYPQDLNDNLLKGKLVKPDGNFWYKETPVSTRSQQSLHPNLCFHPAMKTLNHFTLVWA